MELRLIYHGPLRGSQRNSDAKMAPHQHAIRRKIHCQLKELWARDQRLRSARVARKSFQDGTFRSTNLSEGGTWMELGTTEMAPREQDQELLTLVREEYCPAHKNETGFSYVPLALARYQLDCELNILLLRRGGRDSVVNDGDIDNRIKTLIDALTQPKGQQIWGKPTTAEDPFFVLLENDKQVTKLAVESDILYRPRVTLKKQPNRDKLRSNDDNLVHAVITVRLKPYNVNMFNLMFA